MPRNVTFTLNKNTHFRSRVSQSNKKIKSTRLVKNKLTLLK
jgi:hypothetical protein